MFENLKRRIKQRISSAIERRCRENLYFTPYYNRWHELDSHEPEVYNKEGERLRVFFLSDRESAHTPYGSINKPMRYGSHHIMWDRYNFGLKTHFYSHYEAFLTVGNPDRRYAFLCESRAITPASYEKYIQNKSYFENEFDSVFSFDDEILSTLKNAKLVPFGASYWYGENDSSAISPENYMHKDKNVSIIASNKNMCFMHKVRQDTARKCLSRGIADTFGQFAGGGGGIV